MPEAVSSSIMADIVGAVCRAKAKHPGGLGPHPYAVLTEEAGEAARAFLEGNRPHERAELLDIITVCVRRIEEMDA